ncbi:bifunctional NAD(P)/FAD-dependent oxidoreductase/class I SAM-dependent methyltransferase [Mycolicibacterium neoaurum]|uniref:bifunctional NAD(P)/FAD-dependent oxidoreductase/class I SAM-dependent methyltransferase n=1 Tax=Mycolicibacterium neoaurum TaxID=1795 RepID=UPI003083EFBE
MAFRGDVGKLDAMDNVWDCVVVGGGAAGLSGALVLGRARRATLVVDEGEQSNLAAHGIGGLLGHDGRPPAELYADGRRELEKYSSVQFRSGRVVGATAHDGQFVVELADGGRERARRILLATGMEYRPPQIPGLDALWGGSAFHCPFCHGWEMRDKPLAVLADGDRAVHMALMLRGWSDDIVLLTNGGTAPAVDGIVVDDRVVTEFRSEKGELTEIVFADDESLARRGVLVAATLHQRSPLAAHLGVAFAPPTPVSADAIVVDQFQRTTVPGVFAAGDVSVQVPQVAAAVASGSMAATAVVQSLLADDVGLPVPPWPVPDAQQHWDQHYGQRDRIWSGRVNVRMSEIAAELAPGRALDLGCGEGADAMWLASRGWSVVATDVSEVALERARQDAGELLSHIDFQHHDLEVSFPDGQFDLVSAQFLHSKLPMDRVRVLRRAAEAVAPGGVLLIVDHGDAPPWSNHQHVEFPSAEEVVAGLELGEDWERVRVEAVARDAVGPDGQPGHLTDNVMVLRRR